MSIVTRRFFLAVRDSAKSEFFDWISSDSQAGIRDSLRFHGSPFPIQLLHQASGQGLVALSAWVGENEWAAVKELGNRLPQTIKDKVAFSKGKTDIEPNSPTFDEWLIGLGLIRQ